MQKFILAHVVLMSGILLTQVQDYLVSLVQERWPITVLIPMLPGIPIGHTSKRLKYQMA